MSSFISRGAVLASARLLNQALALLSPLLLVRLLDIFEYGRYRQFMAVAMLVNSLGGFALSANLTYLLARSPWRAATDVTKTAVLMLAVSIVSALIVVVAHRWIVPAEIADSWGLLALYVFMFLNLEVVIAYWVAQRRAVEGMQYVITVTVWRLATLLGAALYFHDVKMIFVTLVVAESLKNVAVYRWLRARRLLVFRWDQSVLREQLRLVGPQGLGSVLNKANDFGRVVVGSVMGPAPLAIYTTAAYQVPLVNIVQTSLSDVIFPDMVTRAQRDPAEGLRLWKRAQMMGAAVILPAWLLLSYFAEPLIRLGFTAEYVSATPYFQVFLLLMVRQCFEFSTLLRSVEDNASFAKSNAIALAINAALIAILMPRFGLWGPTIGMVAGQMWTGYYLACRVMLRYRVPLSEIFQWRKFGLSLLASVLSLAILHGMLVCLPDGLASTVLALGAFALVYVIAARFILREEYGYVMRAFTRRRAAA
ncbi:MAG TPA: oligosaccharide flippase family protein [Steroidobacteraceae bacterium]|jgi:O-antigen/teichoic acid export membrane protein|nr:oligosaccharide flippase family protein [Steroidobacteraceae bacterium]